MSEKPSNSLNTQTPEYDFGDYEFGKYTSRNEEAPTPEASTQEYDFGDYQFGKYVDSNPVPVAEEPGYFERLSGALKKRFIRHRRQPSIYSSIPRYD